MSPIHPQGGLQAHHPRTEESNAPLPRAAPQLQDHVDGASRGDVVVRQGVVVRQLLPAVDQSNLVNLQQSQEASTARAGGPRRAGG